MKLHNCLLEFLRPLLICFSLHLITMEDLNERQRRLEREIKARQKDRERNNQRNNNHNLDLLDTQDTVVNAEMQEISRRRTSDTTM